MSPLIGRWSSVKLELGESALACCLRFLKIEESPCFNDLLGNEELPSELEKDGCSALVTLSLSGDPFLASDILPEAIDGGRSEDWLKGHTLGVT